ncbi:ATP-binding protein [Desulfosediminicola sp.]|uniref:ATP-binding protein n=1 Tax=Desulfosediminicola sp. TaxID=2886825 RepID=UPI003AF2111B
MIVFTKSIRTERHAISSFLHEFRIGYLKWQKLDQKIKDRIEFCLMEAIENAYEHGNKQQEHKIITIRCWHDKDTYTYSVTDEGEGFRPDIPEEPPPLSQKQGRGLYGMKCYADSLHFNDKGNAITFMFRAKRL